MSASWLIARSRIAQPKMLGRSNRLRHGAREQKHYCRLFSVIRAYLDDLDSRRFFFRRGLGRSICEFRDTFCREWDGC
jgi:hypothetical protein